MKFYPYHQNNSGGIFVGTQYYIIQAESAEKADEIAEQHGVYFDPECEIDCECCGSRWSTAWEGFATDEPMLYNTLVSEEYALWAGEIGTIPAITVVYADGTVDNYGTTKE